MASSDDDDQIRNKVEDILIAPEHVVCQLCDEVIPEGCKSAQPRVVPMQDVGQKVLGRVEVATTHAEKSIHESQSAGPATKCIGLSLRTEDNNKRSLVQRRVHHHDGQVQLREEDLWRAHVGQGIILGLPEAVLWYCCSREEAKAKWKSALASPHVHREKVDGVMQVAVKEPTEILHEHNIGTEERTNAKTGNVDKVTAKQLLSDLSESHTFGVESSALGTAALAKRGAVAASSDASESDDDGLRRPMKKRAAGADRACRALVLARLEPVDDGSASLGCERQSTRASSRCTPSSKDRRQG